MFRAATVFSRVISIVIALIFLVVGLVFFLKFDPDAYDTQVTGTIVEIVERYETSGEDNELVHDVYVDYSVNGEEFEHAAYFGYDSGMEVGDTVEFYCMSDDPSQIAGADKEMTPYFGLGFAAIGLIMLAVTVVKLLRGRAM